jgi:hypothetical protein
MLHYRKDTLAMEDGSDIADWEDSLDNKSKVSTSTSVLFERWMSRNEKQIKAACDRYASHKEASENKCRAE